MNKGHESITPLEVFELSLRRSREAAVKNPEKDTRPSPQVIKREKISSSGERLTYDSGLILESYSRPAPLPDISNKRP